MEELPETLKAEIEALDSLDARALKRRGGHSATGQSGFDYWGKRI